MFVNVETLSTSTPLTILAFAWTAKERHAEINDIPQHPKQIDRVIYDEHDVMFAFFCIVIVAFWKIKFGLNIREKGHGDVSGLFTRDHQQYWPMMRDSSSDQMIWILPPLTHSL